MGPPSLRPRLEPPNTAGEGGRRANERRIEVSFVLLSRRWKTGCAGLAACWIEGGKEERDIMREGTGNEEELGGGVLFGE